MAGPTTAQRGAGKQEDAPDRPPRPRPEGRRVSRRRLLLLIAGAVLLLGSGAVWALYGSSWLRVEQVRITGVGVLTPAEVERAAAVPMDAPSSPWTPAPSRRGCARSCLVSTRWMSFGHGRTGSDLR